MVPTLNLSVQCLTDLFLQVWIDFVADYLKTQTVSRGWGQPNQVQGRGSFATDERYQ